MQRCFVIPGILTWTWCQGMRITCLAKRHWYPLQIVVYTESLTFNSFKPDRPIHFWLISLYLFDVFTTNHQSHIKTIGHPRLITIWNLYCDECDFTIRIGAARLVGLLDNMALLTTTTLPTNCWKAWYYLYHIQLCR